MKKIVAIALVLIATTGSTFAQMDLPSYKACRVKLAKEIPNIEGKMMINFIDMCMRTGG